MNANIGGELSTATELVPARSGAQPNVHAVTATLVASGRKGR